VQRVHQVAAVVDDQAGLGVQGPVDVLVVGAPVHPGTGMDGDPRGGGQGRRDVVLGGQRVGRGQVQLRASGCERLNQDRGLRRDMQAGGDREPFERLLPLEGDPD
jgi:hypothetical protein